MAKSYTDLFELTRSLAGVDKFTDDETQDIKRFINRRLYEAYSASQMWTSYLVVGELRQLTAGTQIVPKVEAGKDTIGEFQRIHRQQPFLNNSAYEYDFYVDSRGANILNIQDSDVDGVYVTYKKVFTDFNESSNDIPTEFFYYGAHSAYADFLRMDGQTGKAFEEENKAGTYLATELEKLDIISNNNFVRRKFSTYVSTQSR
jgi:hypothetical protein